MGKGIDKSNPKPMYLQLEEIIKSNIETGKWGANYKLPSESEFAKMYDISRITIRTASNHLINEGLLYRVLGKGTFVSEPKIKTQSLARMGFREQLEDMGYKTKTKLIAKKVIKAGFKLAKKLNIMQGEDVLFIQRVRYLDGDAISLHNSYLSCGKFKLLNEYDVENNQLCHILEDNFNIVQSKVIETLEALAVNEREGKLLNIEEGYPVLLIEDIMYDQHDEVYEYSKVYFRADKVKLAYEYKK